MVIILDEHHKKLLSGMSSNTRGLGTHGHKDNVMLKVLDTANPSICYYKIRPDRFFIDSNEEQRSCIIIIDSIRIKDDNYTYMSEVQCLLACIQVNWSHDTVVCLKRNTNIMHHYAGACITVFSSRSFNH